MKYLVIGPGAMGIYSLIGCLKGLEHELHEVEQIAGASAGAILALFLGLGMSIDSILDASLSIDISEFVKINITSFLNKFGFVDTAAIRKKLVEICGRDPTFKQLKKKIYIAAFCVNTCKTVYFSRDTHPKMKVLDAVCMSIAIPLVFNAYKYKGLTYVDGGTVEDCPVTPFMDKKPHEITCVTVRMENDVYKDVKNPKQFLEAIIRSVLRNRTKYEIKNVRKIDICVDGFNIFDFGLSHEDKLRLFMIGTSYVC